MAKEISFVQGMYFNNKAAWHHDVAFSQYEQSIEIANKTAVHALFWGNDPEFEVIAAAAERCNSISSTYQWPYIWTVT